MYRWPGVVAILATPSVIGFFVKKNTLSQFRYQNSLAAFKKVDKTIAHSQCEQNQLINYYNGSTKISARTNTKQKRRAEGQDEGYSDY